MARRMNGESFWQGLEQLVADHRLVLDRPRGTPHPRYPDWVYPLDYGYLEGTRSADGEGIDVWVGSQPDRGVTGLVCAVDMAKGDAELKILLGCTADEAQRILAVHNRGASAAILIPRSEGEGG